MFRQRTSSQKPGDDLLANFRQQFPEVSAVTTEASASSTIQTTTAADNSTADVHSQDRSRIASIVDDAFRDQDPTPRASHEPWRFTPSLLESNSYAFNAFAGTQPGYYTPTPGGNNTLFHPQAGDLHTPTIGVGGIGTPLSMPNSGEALQAGAASMDMSGFQALQPHQFHHFNPFMPGGLPQQSFVPTSFADQIKGYEAMDQDGPILEASPPGHHAPGIVSPTLQQKETPAHASVKQTLPSDAEKFRFHSTLNAPTAMIRRADEIPITYLNKGQAYLLSVTDTGLSVPLPSGTKYRTFVRISFEEEEQRQKPSFCWGLWKEGRGTSEAHHRGGKLQAVEYVEVTQNVEADGKRSRIALESSSFDGFCVTWTPGTKGPPEVNLSVRFNFLSTDFSHSKGVKGIPVRLCAKTSIVPATDASPKTNETDSEICFCKVKLFRDHGAERKLSNDIAHVKKSIDKLKQQLAQIENGMKEAGKRKRLSSAARDREVQRPGKVQKHKRTWSMSSASSAGMPGIQLSLEEDLQLKLQILQDMFTSTRPLSVLYLRGEDLDNPDLHPVSLPGDMSPPSKVEVRDGSHWQARSTKSSATGSMVSPSPSSLSLTSHTSGAFRSPEHTGAGKTLEQLSKVTRTDESGTLSGWIEALGVDSAYRPPSEHVERPVACFYVKRLDQLENDKPTYHRAIYLAKRTIEEFNNKIASKYGIDAAKILHSIQKIDDHLQIEMDDDVIRELKEGQDMQFEVTEVWEQPKQTKREWEMPLDDAATEGDGGAPLSRGFVLRFQIPELDHHGSTHHRPHRSIHRNSSGE